MSRGRFGLLVALVALLAGVGSFAGGVALLDDGQPDDPPDRGPAPSAPGDSSTSTSTTTTAPPAPDGLSTPAWVAVVSSDRDEAAARAVAAELAEAGLQGAVLLSDDHESLAPGLWVAYTGPYDDRAAAEEAVADLAGRGFDGAYARCVGTDAECGTGGGDGDEGDEGDDNNGNGNGRGNQGNGNNGNGNEGEGEGRSGGD